MLQKDRVYELTVGDRSSGDAVLIKDLQIRFDVSKSSDNKRRANSAVIEIYNLSDSTLSLLEAEYLACTLAVGYATTETQVIVTGNVVDMTTVKNGADKVTQLQLGEGYTDLNHQRLSQLVAPGKTVNDVIEDIRLRMPGVARGAYTGTNLNSKVVHGYPLNGTPRNLLDDLADTYRLEWRVDNGVLYINDINGLVNKDKTSAVLISESTGLIDIPYFTSESGKKQPKDERRRRGVQFQALLNPSVTAGSIIKLVSKQFNGFYRVTDLRLYGDYRGNDWYMDCACSEILEADL